jgi:hypothetical protein
MNSHTLDQLNKEIRAWMDQSAAQFNAQFDESQRIWVVKYFNPAFLAEFLRRKQMVISSSPGFTWGDGVYVTPLANPYSTMMYGRVGVLGWIDNVPAVTAFDAIDPRGVELYQEWITYSTYLYRLLTTTIHADRANRLLRNAFRRSFRIDVTYFRPDQYNKNYVSLSQDHWFVVSDWAGLQSQGPSQRPTFSSRISGCEWVAVVGEQFQESPWKTHFVDLIGPHLHPSGSRNLSNGALATLLRTCHTTTSTGGGQKVAHILE